MAAEGWSPGPEGADRKSATGRRPLSSQRFVYRGGSRVRRACPADRREEEPPGTAAEGWSPGLEGADRKSATGRRTLSSQIFKVYTTRLRGS
jgi:hypothetical protein